VARLRRLLEDPTASGADPLVCHLGNRGLYELTWHRVGGVVVVEIEPTMVDEAVSVSLLYADMRHAMAALDTATGVQALCDVAAAEIKNLTGYDRVMVYRFHNDEHGEVAAEQCEPDQEPFLGLNYPASDIPRQARKLFLLNHLRVIADVSYEPVPLLCVDGDDADPLDLSLSGLRSVSPMHIAYLKNMKVGATLTISLLHGTRLWGMLACHHRTPRRIDAQMRAACRVLGQMFSLQLVAQEHRENQAYRLELADVEIALVARMSGAPSLADALVTSNPSPLELTGADGMVAHLDGQTVKIGSVPPERAIEEMLAQLRADETIGPFVCDDMADRFNFARTNAAAGMIAVPLSAGYVDYAVWFRDEAVRENRWAGNPEKAMTLSLGDGSEPLLALGPRLSFESWVRQEHGKCRPWRSAEVAAAHALAIALPDLLLARARDHLTYLAMHDQLTGLPNRALLLDHTTLALARQQRAPDQVAMLFVDLDRFKLVNDSLGHAAGDNLLRQASARLILATRETDTVARIGGDEFIVLCEGITPPLAAQVAERIVQAFRMPFIVAGSETTVTASIGCALAEPDTTPAELLRDADTAMYRAKQSGRNAVTPFTHEMREITVRRVEMETGLRPALDHGELVLYYQPLLRMDGTVLGFEALARWPLHGRGMVPPTEFIPIAESIGLIGQLTDWALSQGLEDLASWRQNHPELDLSLSVNITASQMITNELRRTIDNALAHHQVPPSSLCIEMTEGALVTDDPRNLAFLTALRSKGVRLSIDDFGTGYSSLSYLTKLPIHELKIDRSFITGLPNTNGNVAVVASVVALAHQLGLEAVAEGVETADELSTLRRLGCDLVQGYLLGRPMPADEIERYLGGAIAA
jgi:diguanylate cyclase (GGDEF)-like protein